MTVTSVATETRQSGTKPLPVARSEPTKSGADHNEPRKRRRPQIPLWIVLIVLVAVPAALLYALPGTEAGLPQQGRVTLVVFVCAILAFLSGRVDDTFVGLAAAVTLVLLGVLSSEDLFLSLGGEIIWLLIAAFVLATGLNATGLPARFAIMLVSKATSVRRLAHLVTGSLLVTALAVPATSGRAALALPVFIALARALAPRERVVRMLAVLFPTVILLSAVATLIGAGAHLITSQVLAATTGQGIGFGQWLLLGLPFAAVSSHLATELVLWLMTRHQDRCLPLHIDRDELAAAVDTNVDGPLSNDQRRAGLLLLVVVTLWCTEAFHGVSPAMVALLGAVAITTPGLGTVRMGKAMSSVPWSLLLFMATTAVLGTTLTGSGAADWLARTMFNGTDLMSPEQFMAVVVAVSTLAHLVLQSRSARSSVLVPLLLPLAVAFGLNPAAVAFASTAAAGFCHTLPSSAKPVAMFAAVEGVTTYRRSDLLKISVFLAPLIAALVMGFALYIWPLLGLPLR
ncbi:anion transporter [Sinosporangium album]|uniref:Anion transporter n=2 Tax=Sinosporangium album TaxID=504805 RepID=A0A1G8EXP3_9ACTN|nr:SLC13 family permease [Sinosporangium album]SDH74640.1 anion transporter [Sinosporangium album]